jgi:hypothetical protein
MSGLFRGNVSRKRRLSRKRNRKRKPATRAGLFFGRSKCDGVSATATHPCGLLNRQLNANSDHFAVFSGLQCFANKAAYRSADKGSSRSLGTSGARGHIRGSF